MVDTLRLRIKGAYGEQIVVWPGKTTLIRGRLLSVAPTAVLLPTLSAILLVSAWKVWGQK